MCCYIRHKKKKIKWISWKIKIKQYHISDVYKYFQIMNTANSHSIDTLKKYVNQALTDSQKISFFILNGPKNIWKSQIVQDLAKEILWQFFYSDFLHIRDLSDFLWKEHIIKVDSDENRDDYKSMLTECNYKDMWTRDILDWIYRSPSWKNKIILIENIERMNNSSYNAFLKTCEEVLPDRVIIATTSNKSKILDTILSRAITINFFADSDNIFAGNDELKELFQNTVAVLEWDDVAQQNNALLTVNASGHIQDFLDYLVAYYTQHGNFTQADKRLKIKKLAQTNVSTEHLLFSGLL